MPIDLPLAHGNALSVCSRSNAIGLVAPDAPQPGELLIASVVACTIAPAG